MTEDLHNDLILAASEARRTVRQLSETLACVEQSLGLAGAKLYMRQALELATEAQQACRLALRDAAEEEA